MEHIVEAAARDGQGRGGARALRREGRVPGILYGGDKALPFSCEARALALLMQDEKFHSSVVTVRLDGVAHRALLRETQRHPVRRDVIHLDFQVVREDREIAVQVPIHFINVESAPGVRLQGGVFTAIENQVAAHCLPQHLPEFIEVDAGALEIGKSIHLGDITPPEGVRFDEIVRGNNPALAVVSSIAEEVEEAPAAAEEADADAPKPDAPAAEADK